MNLNATAADLYAAKGAFNMTSMVPERREEAHRSSYLSTVAEVEQEFSQWETDENREQMQEDLEYWRQRFAAAYNAYLSARSRIVSQFITGAGGWTAAMVRANDKRNDTADRRLAELVHLSEDWLDKLRRRYDPKLIARRPIRLGEDDALERIDRKIERKTELQEIMKQANKIVRSKKLSDDEKVAALSALPGISPTTAYKVLQPDFMGRIGFPSYALSNNNAEINRLKKRREQIAAMAKADANADVTEWRFEGNPGGTVCNNIEANRYQIFYDEKPDEQVRAHLRRWGGNFSRRNGNAWQFQRTPNGRAAVKALTGITV